VRSLAKDSAENAEKIKDIVKRVQQQVNKVTVDIEQATSKAQQDVEYAQKSTASLTQIESNFAWLAGFVKNIVASNEETLVAITQAAKGVEQTARMAEETGAAAEEPGVRTFSASIDSTVFRMRAGSTAILKFTADRTAPSTSFFNPGSRVPRRRPVAA